MSQEHYILTFSCKDVPGIVYEVASQIFNTSGNILESHQYNDSENDLFFMRTSFVFENETGIADFRACFAMIADRYGMTWKIHAGHEPKKVLILASKSDHCLADLLYRRRIGELKMHISGIVSNHPRDTYQSTDLGDLPFHHLPITPATKAKQEGRIWQIFNETGSELVILARYMQVLSAELVEKLQGRCINIHHSFLPGFKGAKPYHQAHQRGVKLIGATAHYVTGDLDEGPIIEQDVERISHSDTPDDLVRKGRDIERRVLARAVALHLDGRVIPNGSKTIVFRD
ncbi:MAG: formyltetrahydrofolate deformylase [Sandarakinorhabdus sp.]|nr:formyltetrahydrofolate deformylase [Sandarakinorhabdus sp.]